MTKLLAAACASIAVFTAACASATTGDAPSTRSAVASATELHGQWVLTHTIDKGRVTRVPASFDIYLVFGKNHELRGFDGCAHFDGRLRPSPGGATRAVNVGISSNGCLKLAAAVATASNDIDLALYRSQPIHVSETAHRLDITTSGHTLTYVPRR